MKLVGNIVNNQYSGTKGRICGSLDGTTQHVYYMTSCISAYILMNKKYSKNDLGLVNLTESWKYGSFCRILTDNSTVY